MDHARARRNRGVRPLTALSIFAAAREQPDALALLDGPNRLTFRDVAEQCEPYALALTHHQPSALSLTPRADLPSLLWLYAAFATGTPVLPLHLRATSPEREQAQALAHASPPPALAAGAWQERALSPIAAESPLVFIPTSGSTGTPRLAQLSRRAVLASAAASAANLGWLEGDRWLLCLPLAHVGGLSIVLRTLIARQALVLFEPGSAGLLGGIPELAHTLVTSRATLLSLVPSVLSALLDSGFTPPPPLRAVLLGGSGCSPALARRAESARLPLLTSYGLSETASQVVTRPYSERFAPLALQFGAVSSGRPLPGVELEVRSGLLAIRAPSLFSGYVGGAASSLDTDGWFVTTDLGTLSDDGSLFVRGRSDDVIITAGENVDPLEVEAALTELPGVHAACVFGVASARYGQVVAAVLVCDDARLAEPGVVAQLLSGHLARHKLPRTVARLVTLPLTPNGKLDRRACRAHSSGLLRPPVT